MVFLPLVLPGAANFLLQDSPPELGWPAELPAAAFQHAGRLFDLFLFTDKGSCSLRSYCLFPLYYSVALSHIGDRRSETKLRRTIDRKLQPQWLIPCKDKLSNDDAPLLKAALPDKADTLSVFRSLGKE